MSETKKILQVYFERLLTGNKIKRPNQSTSINSETLPGKTWTTKPCRDKSVLKALTQSSQFQKEECGARRGKVVAKILPFRFTRGKEEYKAGLFPPCDKTTCGTTSTENTRKVLRKRKSRRRS